MMAHDEPVSGPGSGSGRDEPVEPGSSTAPLSRSITGLPDGMRVEDLPRTPDLGTLYMRAGGRAVTAKIPGAAAPALALPPVAYRVGGVRADLDLLNRYEALLREPAGDTLPAGFVHVLAFPAATAVMVRPDFPVSLLGMVHLSNAVSVLRPIRIDEDLEITTWTQDLLPHRRGAQVNVVAEVRVDGLVAWRGVSTYLAKGVFLPQVPAENATGAEPTSAWVSDGGSGTSRVPSGVWTLAADVGRLYGAVSGDRNPIHMSGLSAKAFGFPRAIAHGMYTAARALAQVGPGRGPAFDWTVEFASPILLPSKVNVAIHRTPSGEYDYEAWNPKTNKTNLKGTVTPR